jgi:hypothetical protein
VDGSLHRQNCGRTGIRTALKKYNEPPYHQRAVR